MNCPLCGASCTQPGWWCNQFLNYFPKFNLTIGELVYHLKVTHGTKFLCPCGDTSVVKESDVAEAALVNRLQLMCEHYESLTDVEEHILFHALGKKNVSLPDL